MMAIRLPDRLQRRGGTVDGEWITPPPGGV
jgi:hypothetical protein